MGECGRPIPPPYPHETASQRHGIDSDRQQRPGQRNGVGQAAHWGRQWCWQPDIALAGERDIRPPTNDHALDDESAKRDHQHDPGQHRSAAKILLRANNGEEYLSGKHTEGSAQHNWVAKIC